VTTSLDAYRSDREQLLARVRELEAALAEREAQPLDWPHQCPLCGTKIKHNTQVPDSFAYYNGWTYPKIGRGLWHWLFCRNKKQHFHQRCTACGARWVVDAEGWRFG
jgi:hypothetical protein